jgi:TonB family protein
MRRGAAQAQTAGIRFPELEDDKTGTPPTPILQRDADFPEEALTSGIKQATVSLSVLITPQGTVEDILVKSGDRLFVKAAIEAAKQWRFNPAKDGHSKFIAWRTFGYVTNAASPRISQVAAKFNF